MKTFKTFLKEMGGNVFAGKTESIPKEYIKPTLDEYFDELKAVFPKLEAIFSLKHFHPLGSVGKKPMSGDIDLAVDFKTLIPTGEFNREELSAWKIDEDEFAAQVQKLQKRAKSASLEQLKAKAFLQLVSQVLIDESGEIFADVKKVTPGNAFTLFPQYTDKGKRTDIGVQIDWMAGNLAWLKFSYYSDVYKDNVKGLHRTQLMLAMFDAAGYSFNHVSGVKNKETGEVVAEDPESALRVLGELYNAKIDEKSAANYFTLHEILKKSGHAEEVYDIYLKILDRTRADIPLDLQEYWIDNQDRLGLTGKFLPDDSRLYPLRKV